LNQPSNFSIFKFGATLRSSTRDVVLIVVGITIAFVLDAWWNDKIEQKELRDTLQAVHVDFLATKQELTDVVVANEAYIEGVMALVSLRPEDIEKTEIATKAELANLLPTGGITFDPVLGSLDAFITSGQLNRVQNLDVRSLVGAWPGLMDEIGEDQYILIEMYLAQQERSVELGVYLMDIHREIAKESADADARILRTVIDDQEMLNRLAAHRFAAQSLHSSICSENRSLDYRSGWSPTSAMGQYQPLSVSPGERLLSANTGHSWMYHTHQPGLNFRATYRQALPSQQTEQSRHCISTFFDSMCRANRRRNQMNGAFLQLVRVQQVLPGTREC